MSRQRLKHIDIIKGITIFFMVLGHSYSEGNGEYIIQWIYSFHMPLFFITTGILYGTRKEKNIQIDVKKKAKTLLWPYLFWGTVYQLFLAMLQIMGGAPIREATCNILKNIITVNGSSMWFLVTMFGAVLLFSFLWCCIKNEKGLIIVTAVAMLVSIIWAPINNELLVICIRIFVATGFISIGYFFEKIYNSIIKMKYLYFLMIVHIIITVIMQPVSMVSLTFGNPAGYILISCLGTLVVYEWGKKINVNSKVGGLLILWGKNSLKILCLHGFVVQLIRLFDYKFFGEILPLLGYGEGIIFSIIIMLILTCVLKKGCFFLDWTFGK